MSYETSIAAPNPFELAPRLLDFDDAWDLFVASKRNVSQGTLRQYRLGWDAFTAFCQQSGAPLLELRPSHLIAFREAVDNSELASSTLAIRLCAVRGVLKRLALEDLIHPSVRSDRIETYLLSPKQVQDKLPTYLTAEEANALYAEMRDERDRAIVRLMLGVGLRIAEVLSLRLGDFEPKRDGTAVLSFVGKGGKARALTIPPKVFSAVQRHARKRRLSWSRASDLDTKMFDVARTTVSGMLKYAGKRAGIQKRISPHTLRHTHATLQRAAGEPLETIQQRLGHSSITTTAQYSHLAALESGTTYELEWMK